MKHIFLDTNIIIDFLSDRKPFSMSAAKLFNFSLAGKIKLYISAVFYNNIYNILRQSQSASQTVKHLQALSEMTEITNVTKDIIKKALKSAFKDFEDAIQYYSALSNNKIDVIVTRNTKDFKESDLAIMTPEEAVKLIENNGK